MENLSSFLRASTTHFDYYRGDGSAVYRWRSLMFSHCRIELDKAALTSLSDGLNECKISKTPYKRSNMFVLTTFHATIAEALAFRSRWLDNPTTAVAGPIPLGTIETQFLQRELSAEAAQRVMTEIFGSEGEPLILMNLVTSKS